jgi:hypothetical protein
MKQQKALATNLNISAAADGLGTNPENWLLYHNGREYIHSVEGYAYY